MMSHAFFDRNLARMLPAASVESTESPKMPGNHVDILTRCTAKQLYEIYRIVSTEDHKQIITRTCFGPLFEGPLVEANVPLISVLMDVWNESESCFRIGDVDLELTADHVSQILGLPNEGAEVQLKDDQDYAPWVRKWVPSGRVDRPKIVAVLRKLGASGATNDVADFARFMIFLLFTSVLFQRSNYSCAPNLSYYLEDLEEVSNYKWSDAIHRFLLKSVSDVHLRTTTKKNRQTGRVTYINGAAFVLSAWFYDITGSDEWIDPRPRICRWVLTPCHKEPTYRRQVSQMTTAQIFGPLVKYSIKRVADTVATSPVTEGPLPLGDSSLTCYIKEKNEECSVCKSKFDAISTELEEVKTKQKKMKNMIRELQNPVTSFIKKMDEVTYSKFEKLTESSPLREFAPASCNVYKPALVFQPVKLEKSPTSPLKTYSTRKTGKPKNTIVNLTPLASQKKKVEWKTIAKKVLREKGLIKEDEREILEKIAALEDDSFIVWSAQTTQVSRGLLMQVINGGMISGEVINCRQLMYDRRGLEDYFSYTPCIFFDTLVTQALESKNSALLDLCMRPLEGRPLREQHYLLIPLFIAKHWHLLCVDLKKGVQLHYSSISAAGYLYQAREIGEWVKEFLSSRYMDVYEEGMTNGQKWDVLSVTDIPRQRGSVDCAIFLLEYEDRIQRSVKVEGFSQQHMRRLRIKLTVDIANDGVLVKPKHD